MNVRRVCLSGLLLAGISAGTGLVYSARTAMDAGNSTIDTFQSCRDTFNACEAPNEVCVEELTRCNDRAAADLRRF